MSKLQCSYISFPIILGILSCNVMGRTLVVNKESIACVLGILDEEECNEDQPFSDTIKTIKNQSAYLSFENRILHLFISYVLRPFGTKYSTIRDTNYWWL